MAQRRVNDGAAKLSTDGWSAAISAAVREYSVMRPQKLVEAIDGANAFDYLLFPSADSVDTPVVTAWQDGFSVVNALLYPYVVGGRDQSQVEPMEYHIVRLPTGIYLRFVVSTPSVGESILVEYTAQQQLSVGPPAVSTHPAVDDEAVADVIAACACDALASLYVQSTDSSIGADVVNRLSKAQEYRAQAKAWRAAYEQRMGGAEGAAGGTPPAGGASAALETRFVNPVQDRHFFHGIMPRGW
jgi:hypothetical protein